MSGTTGANLPVRIEVQGTQQAEAQFNRVGQAGQAAMQRVTQSTDDASGSARRFGYVAGQAGFQVQDFAVQVQSGTSALTALSQQGSQFLGAFGTGGAIAGAALTVGILAAQFFNLGEETDAARESSERYTSAERAFQDAIRTTIELTETAADRTRRLADERRSTALLALTDLGNELEGQRYLINRQINELASRRPDPLTQVDALGNPLPGAQGRERTTERDAYLLQLDAIAARLADIEEARRRLNNVGVDRGEGQFGPPAPTPERPERPGRAPRDTFENDFDRFIRSTETALEQYERRIREISTLEEEARSRGNPIPAENIQRAVDAALADFERLERGTKRVGDETQRAGGYAQQLGLSFSSAFEDAVVKGNGLSDVLKGLEQDIARIIIRTAVTTPLANAIAGVISPFGTSIGNAFADPTLGGKVGGSISVSAAGARASGGPVFPGGTYLVGERGPELLTMGAAGFVTPNVGGPSITQNFNIDARGADASMVPRLRAEMVAIARASNAELLDSIQRGGSAARIVGRRA